MIELLQSYGLTPSESVILAVSIVTFIITTGMNILFNYITNRQDRISREREWKFKVYYEFFNVMDANITLLTKKISEYTASSVNNLVAIMENPDIDLEDFAVQSIQFTGSLNELMGEISKSKERISLFTGKESNEALDEYVDSIHVMFDKSMNWLKHKGYDNIMNVEMRVLLDDFTSYMNDNISEVTQKKEKSYKAIRGELGIGGK